MQVIKAINFSGDTVELPKSRFTFRPSAYLIAIENGKVLLVKDVRSNRYNLPGGGMEPGETIFETLKREASEEIGTSNISLEKIFDVKENYFYHDPSDNAWHAIIFFAKAKILSKKVLEEL